MLTSIHVGVATQDHVTEIENKLVTIVGSVFDRHLAKWEVKAPMPSSAFRNICKQVAKFHETIGSLLPEVGSAPNSSAFELRD